MITADWPGTAVRGSEATGGIAADALGGCAKEVRYLNTRLFDPIGITTARLLPDPRGCWYGGLGADLVIVGPEAPLVAGVADAVRAAGIRCFGPGQAAAMIEGSKSFAKDVMLAAGIATAARPAPRTAPSPRRGRGRPPGPRTRAKQARSRGAIPFPPAAKGTSLLGANAVCMPSAASIPSFPGNRKR